MSSSPMSANGLPNIKIRSRVMVKVTKLQLVVTKLQLVMLDSLCTSKPGNFRNRFNFLGVATVRIPPLLKRVDMKDE